MTTNYAAVGLLETLRGMQRLHETNARGQLDVTAVARFIAIATGYESAAVMVAEALPRIIAEALAGATEIPAPTETVPA